jgi:hypothetical protein
VVPHKVADDGDDADNSTTSRCFLLRVDVASLAMTCSVVCFNWTEQSGDKTEKNIELHQDRTDATKRRHEQYNEINTNIYKGGKIYT